MTSLLAQRAIRMRRIKRTRSTTFGTAIRPRISLFKSNQFIYVQLIDDEAHRTLFSVSTRDIKEKMNRTKQSARLGELVALGAKKAGVMAAVLHRGQYKYHGHLKAFAEAARANGLAI